MNLSLDFSPFVSLPVLVLFAVLAIAVATVFLAARVRGGFLRALALAALIAALANPVVVRELRDPLETVVAVVVDRSGSQVMAGRAENADAIGDSLVSRIDSLDGIRAVRVDLGERPDTEDGTELFARVEAALETVPAGQVGGAILVTDGLIHDVPDTLDALDIDAPIHALITGAEDERDRRIILEQAPRYGIVGQAQTIRYRVVDEGAAGTNAGEPVDVIVARDGETLSVERVPLGEAVTIDVPLTHAGETVVTLEAAPLDDEITDLNNRIVASIEGIRENLRVLLVSGEPHAGERTWRNLLKSDAAVDLVHFTILRPPEKQDGTPINQLSLIAFPTRELFSEKIEDFDLIIFDRYQRRGVLPRIYFNNITEYVRNGGAVLVAAGPDFSSERSLYTTSLSEILPAAPSGSSLEGPYHPRLSDEGIRHPVTRDLPGSQSEPPAWSRWFRLLDTASVSGTVVMEGLEEKPLLVLDRQGEGRVALLLSDHAWLWARGYEGGGPHVPLLRRLGHWLMGEPELEEERLTARRVGGLVVLERRSMAESVAPVTVTAPDGTETEVTLDAAIPGLWRGSAPFLGQGLYRARDAAGDDRLSILTSIGPANPLEFEAVISTDDRVAAITAETGGTAMRIEGSEPPRVSPMRTASRYYGSGWIGIHDRQAYVVTGLETYPLIAGLLGLALLLGALAAMWYREGR
ncbi:MAG: hypothetical protein AAF638_01950 [Pseudomonadota bacterium]